MAQQQRKDLTSVNLEFGLDLYKKIVSGSESSNLFLSPFLISTALTLTYLGARGDTAAQMRHGLRLDELGYAVYGQLHKHMKMLNKKQKNFQLKIANRMFVSSEYSVLVEYVKQMKSCGTDSAFSEFKTDSESEVSRIHQWVDTETDGKIRRLITYIHPDTVILFINAVYFKGTWTKSFDASINEGMFTLLNGSRVSVNLMHVRDKFRFTHSESLQCSVLELTYSKQEKLSMLIFLPDRHRGLLELEQDIDCTSIDQALERFNITTVDVLLPRFSLESSFNLGDVLPSLGMLDMFDREKADFTGIGSPRGLWISEILHKAVLEVDEGGMRTSSARSGNAGNNGLLYPKCLEYFCVNRPFLFLIKDNRTGMVLFMGRVTHPGGKVVPADSKGKYVFSMPM